MFALVLALLLSAGGGACTVRTSAPIPPHQQNFDGAVFQECTSVCVRPGDCAQAFNDDGICPPGFLCALRFSCAPSD
ncbi:MAG: hypothetical protein JWM53_3318 [bacterium]|nr:hypothetical protein [bacterium]